MQTQSLAKPALATTPITLEITQADIDAGIKEDCGACPIAIAFKRTCPGTAKVEVGRKYLSFWTLEWEQHDVVMPYVAQDFVQTHDHGLEDPSPFYFNLPLPTHLVSTPGFLADETDASPVATWESPL